MVFCPWIRNTLVLLGFCRSSAGIKWIAFNAIFSRSVLFVDWSRCLEISSINFFTSGSSWHHKYTLMPVDYLIICFFNISLINPSRNGVPIKILMLVFWSLDFVIVFIWFVGASRVDICGVSLVTSSQVFKKFSVSTETSSANMTLISLIV